MTGAITPGRHARSPAQVGTVFLGLLLVLGNCWFAERTCGPVPPLMLHLSGGATPGWYAGATAGEALRSAGAEVAFLVGEPHDGDEVRVFGAYGIVEQPTTPIAYRATGAKLHLNTATLADLEALPRVGPTLAKRIRAGRPYRRVDDLDAVRGIGAATIAALRPFVQP